MINAARPFRCEVRGLRCLLLGNCVGKCSAGPCGLRSLGFVASEKPRAIKARATLQRVKPNPYPAALRTHLNICPPE